MKQYELEQYLQEVINECRRLKIPISDRIDPQIHINKRAKSRFAACKKAKRFQESYYTIEVGSALLELDRQKIKTILAHEILHTCYGCYNHGDRWKAYRDKMNQAYGYQIKTTATYEELGLERPEQTITHRYVIICKECGRQIYRQKKSKLITNINQYQCKCGGRLECIKLDREQGRVKK